MLFIAPLNMAIMVGFFFVVAFFFFKLFGCEDCGILVP